LAESQPDARQAARLNRKRKIGLLLAILLAVFFGIATRCLRQGSESADSKDHSSVGQPREATQDEGERKAGRPSRANDSGSKLRSLFDVRKGEIAALSVPPEIMKQLQIPLPPDSPDDANYDGPRMLGVLNRKLPLSLLQPAESSIKGVVDTSEDTFELNVGTMKISGSAFGAEGGTRLHMNVLAGANSIECVTRVPEGTCVLLSSGGENPEGVLIVTGPRGETGETGK
jgi:hypothetical protein